MSWEAPKSGGYNGNGPKPDPMPAPPKSRSGVLRAEAAEARLAAVTALCESPDVVFARMGIRAVTVERIRAAVAGGRPGRAAMTAESCNGICIMGSELIEGASGVAHAHPECPKHGDPCRNGRCRDHHRVTSTLADGSEGEYCCACSWEAFDYVWPCQTAPAADHVAIFDGPQDGCVHGKCERCCPDHESDCPGCEVVP